MIKFIDHKQNIIKSKKSKGFRHNTNNKTHFYIIYVYNNNNNCNKNINKDKSINAVGEGGSRHSNTVRDGTHYSSGTEGRYIIRSISNTETLLNNQNTYCIFINTSYKTHYVRQSEEDSCVAPKGCRSGQTDCLFADINGFSPSRTSQVSLRTQFFSLSGSEA